MKRVGVQPGERLWAADLPTRQVVQIDTGVLDPWCGRYPGNGFPVDDDATTGQVLPYRAGRDLSRLPGLQVCEDQAVHSVLAGRGDADERVSRARGVEGHRPGLPLVRRGDLQRRNQVHQRPAL